MFSQLGIERRRCGQQGNLSSCFPAWLQGDTTTAFITGLAGFYHKIRIGHIEAGLRTYHRYSPFPEELNRRLLSSLASIHFAPTALAAQHLAAEGIPAERVFTTGNTVIDALKWMSEQPPSAAASALIATLYAGIADRSSVRVVLVTAHRRENWGDRMKSICSAVAAVADAFPDIRVVFPVHLNPLVQSVVRESLGKHPSVVLWDPLSYDAFAYLMKFVHLVLTDSGGIQEEATFFSVPILVLRDTTERPEGVEAGMAKLIGTAEADIVREASLLLRSKEEYQKMVRSDSPYGR